MTNLTISGAVWPTHLNTPEQRLEAGKAIVERFRNSGLWDKMDYFTFGEWRFSERQAVLEGEMNKESE